MLSLTAPEASADSTELADWMEFSALMAAGTEASAQDLITAIGRTGSSDAILHEDEEEPWDNGGDVDEPPIDEAVEREDETLERIADATLEQLERREQYLGDLYPFTVSGVLKAKSNAIETAYTFLTAITIQGWKNHDAPEKAASLFEELSAAALVGYLGGTASARSFNFGFPRYGGPPGFGDAVNELCNQFGEGGGFREDRPNASNVKDANLDLVAWVPFGDARPNQLSFFGQCATGANWRNKLTELQPVDFCKTWLREQPAMDPLLAFFVPRHIKEDHWPAAVNSDRRLVFDRLRISSLLREIDEDLARRCSRWTESLFG